MVEDLQVPQLSIVNTNWRTNNIVNLCDKEVIQRIFDALQDFSELLQSHCGPHSGYAMLLSAHSLGEDKVPSLFTRDGIRVMSAVNCLSPIEQFIKNLLVYIGSRVDSRAKDGTTTSMLWACEFLKSILTLRLQSQDPAHISDLPLTEISSVIDDIFNKIHNSLDGVALTFDELAKDMSEAEACKLAGKIAFCQALSSSGGNLVLANAMREIFEKSPRISWEYITFSFAGIETEEQFFIRKNDYDYKLACIPNNENVLTQALGTEYSTDLARCIVFSDSVAAGSDTLEILLNLLQEYSRNGGIVVGSKQVVPLCLIAPYFDANLIATIEHINKHLPENARITTWLYSALESLNGKAYDWHLKVLPAIAGSQPISASTILPAGNMGEVFSEYGFWAKLAWENKYLYFYDIIPEEAISDNLHPFASGASEPTPYYSDVLASVKRLLENIKDSHNKSAKQEAVYVEILNLLTVVHKPTLTIGGTTHDQAANVEVAKDVMGAIMSSLNSGFLIDGVCDMYKAVSEVVLKQPSTAQADERKNKLFAQVGSCVNDSLRKVIDTVYGPRADKMVFTNTGDHNYTNSLSDKSDLKFEDYLAHLDGEYDDEKLCEEYPVLQPIDISHEILDRIFELMIKFMLTNKMVVDGGVMVKEETK